MSYSRNKLSDCVIYSSVFSSPVDAVVATVAFFDQFDIALSSAEVWMYCASYRHQEAKLLAQASPQEAKLCHQKLSFSHHTLSEIEGLLHSDPRLTTHNGLWMLKGREELAMLRVKRGFPIHERWAIAGRAARLAAFVPFLKLFAVCNTLGYGVSKEDSDIDVFVVAQRGRLWTVRFFLTTLLHLFGLRRHGKRIAKRICLSFFVATDSLSMAPLSLFPEPSLPRESSEATYNSLRGEALLRGRRATDDTLDPYLAWWLGSVVPLYDRGAYADFITANRPFIERYRQWFQLRQPLPTVVAMPPGRQASPLFPVIASEDPATAGSKRSNPRHERDCFVVPSDGTPRNDVQRNFFQSVIECVLSGFLGNALEHILRFLQLRKIRRSSVGRVRENPTSVVVSDHVLKFHENDRRAAIRDAWFTQLEELHVQVIK